MPDYEETKTVEIDAPPQACFDVLTDYEAMPQWQSRVSEINVLSTDDDGRGREVEYVIDAKLRKVRYTLEHTYEEPSRIGSKYVEGDFKQFDGDYRFEEQEGGTLVTFHLKIDPGMHIPGRVANMLNDAVMGQALKDLKKRVESPDLMARNEVFISAPPRAVFEVLSDPAAYSDWVVGSNKIRTADEDFPAPGTAFGHTVGKGPLRLSDETCVIDAEPPVLLKLRAKARPLPPADITMYLQPEGPGTRVTMIEAPASALLSLAHRAAGSCRDRRAQPRVAAPAQGAGRGHARAPGGLGR